MEPKNINFILKDTKLNQKYCIKNIVCFIIVFLFSYTLFSESKDSNASTDMTGFYISDKDTNYGLWIEPAREYKSQDIFSGYLIRHVRITEGVPVFLDWHTAVSYTNEYPKLQFHWLHLKEPWDKEGKLAFPLGTTSALYDLTLSEKELEGTVHYPFDKKLKKRAVSFKKQERYISFDKKGKPFFTKKRPDDSIVLDKKKPSAVTAKEIVPDTFSGLYDHVYNQDATAGERGEQNGFGLKITKQSDGIYLIYSVMYDYKKKTYKRDYFSFITIYNPFYYPEIQFSVPLINFFPDPKPLLYLYRYTFKDDILEGKAYAFDSNTFSSARNLIFKKIAGDYTEEVITNFDTDLLQFRKGNYPFR